ncbi:MAG: hypothetical protein WEF51_02550 [Chloroflexota bacterium]
MPRRLLIFLALTASLAVIACSSTPQAPALTDPKDILVKSVTSLATVKTATVKGTFNGSVNATGTGAIDLSSVKVDAAVDIPAKKTRVTVDAPTIMGTKVDLIVADGNLYLQVVGPLAAFVGGDATGKYTKTSAETGTVPSEASDPAKAIEELGKAIDGLPNAPEKLADERCGDQDCYHVKLAMTADQLGELAEGATMGSLSVDIFSRKNDLRPAKITFAMDMGAQGNLAGTFEFTYDQGVNISAPPADQIAP